MREKVVIIGAGGHAKVIADCIDSEKYELVGFLDKDDTWIGKEINGVPIIGNDREPSHWIEKGITACIIGIGHVGKYELRNKLYSRYQEAGFHMITAVHPQSVVAKTAVIKAGTVVMPGAVINANAYIGENVIINTNSVIEHDSLIENGVHVAPGSTISGGVNIGENVLVGAGSVVIQTVKIGKNTIIGAGTIVIKDIPSNVLAVGNPAHIVREEK